jgi:hypothetical protein
MTQRIHAGSVTENGIKDHFSSTDGNQDFDIEHKGAGTYEIKFNPALQHPASVVGTVFNPRPASGTTDVTPIDNFTVEGFNSEGFIALTGDVYGKRSNHNFSFIVIEY